MRDAPLRFDDADGWVRRGRVVSVAADHLVVKAPALTPNCMVHIARDGAARLLARVRSITSAGAHCVPLERAEGVLEGARATSDLATLGAYVGPSLLGRAVDAYGRKPGAIRIVAPVDAPPVPLDERAEIAVAMRTGVAAIDAFMPIGHGQRVAVVAGAGVGKTTLLRRIIEGCDVDMRVVALVGERAREASETIARLERSERWSTTTVYAATAQAPPMERFAAAQSAAAQAEWLCARGKRVLLVLDSLTRVAMAHREMALAAGESPAQRGYPPSMAGALAKIVERAGARRGGGSITAIFSVLVEADDPFEPVTDALRAMLDGHIALSRKDADAGRYPAIDVLRSLSRSMPDVTSAEHQRDAALVRRALSALEQAEDLLAIGAFRRGDDPWLDASLAARPAFERLVYDGDGYRPFELTLAELAAIAASLDAAPGRTRASA